MKLVIALLLLLALFTACTPSPTEVTPEQAALQETEPILPVSEAINPLVQSTTPATVAKESEVESQPESEHTLLADVLTAEKLGQSHNYTNEEIAALIAAEYEDSKAGYYHPHEAQYNNVYIGNTIEDIFAQMGEPLHVDIVEEDWTSIGSYNIYVYDDVEFLAYPWNEGGIY